MALLAAFASQEVSASTCEMAWKSRAQPDIVSTSAYLVTQSGERVNYKVIDHYLLEVSFKLSCGNGSIVEIGRSPYCGGDSREWPTCDYGLLVDRAKQSFKLRENAYPVKTECEEGIAKTTFGFHLSQSTFSFEAFVEIKGRQATPKRPVGF
jgi:hypothetical protein